MIRFRPRENVFNCVTQVFHNIHSFCIDFNGRPPRLRRLVSFSLLILACRLEISENPLSHAVASLLPVSVALVNIFKFYSCRRRRRFLFIHCCVYFHLTHLNVENSQARTFQCVFFFLFPSFLWLSLTLMK